MPAAGDGEAVDKPGLVHQLADVRDVVGVAAAGDEVVAAYAYGQRDVGADDLADGRQRLYEEAGAAVDVAAVLVGAQVGQRGEELPVEVAGVRLYLYAVEAGLEGVGGGLGLPLNELVYLLDRQLARISMCV